MSPDTPKQRQAKIDAEQLRIQQEIAEQSESELKKPMNTEKVIKTFLNRVDTVQGNLRLLQDRYDLLAQRSAKMREDFEKEKKQGRIEDNPKFKKIQEDREEILLVLNSVTSKLLRELAAIGGAEAMQGPQEEFNNLIDGFLEDIQGVTPSTMQRKVPERTKNTESTSEPNELMEETAFSKDIHAFDAYVEQELLALLKQEQELQAAGDTRKLQHVQKYITHLEGVHNSFTMSKEALTSTDAEVRKNAKARLIKGMPILKKNYESINTYLGINDQQFLQEYEALVGINSLNVDESTQQEVHDFHRENALRVYEYLGGGEQAMKRLQMLQGNIEKIGQQFSQAERDVLFPEGDEYYHLSLTLPEALGALANGKEGGINVENHPLFSTQDFDDIIESRLQNAVGIHEERLNKRMHLQTEIQDLKQQKVQAQQDLLVATNEKRRKNTSSNLAAHEKVIDDLIENIQGIDLRMRHKIEDIQSLERELAPADIARYRVQAHIARKTGRIEEADRLLYNAGVRHRQFLQQPSLSVTKKSIDAASNSLKNAGKLTEFEIAMLDSKNIESGKVLELALADMHKLENTESVDDLASRVDYIDQFKFAEPLRIQERTSHDRHYTEGEKVVPDKENASPSEKQDYVKLAVKSRGMALIDSLPHTNLSEVDSSIPEYAYTPWGSEDILIRWNQSRGFWEIKGEDTSDGSGKVSKAIWKRANDFNYSNGVWGVGADYGAFVDTLAKINNGNTSLTDGKRKPLEVYNTAIPITISFPNEQTLTTRVSPQAKKKIDSLKEKGLKPLLLTMSEPPPLYLSENDFGYCTSFDGLTEADKNTALEAGYMPGAVIPFNEKGEMILEPTADVKWQIQISRSFKLGYRTSIQVNPDDPTSFEHGTTRPHDVFTIQSQSGKSYKVAMEKRHYHMFDTLEQDPQAKDLILTLNNEPKQRELPWKEGSSKSYDDIFTPEDFSFIGIQNGVRVRRPIVLNESGQPEIGEPEYESASQPEMEREDYMNDVLLAVSQSPNLKQVTQFGSSMQETFNTLQMLSGATGTRQDRYINYVREQGTLLKSQLPTAQASAVAVRKELLALKEKLPSTGIASSAIEEQLEKSIKDTDQLIEAINSEGIEDLLNFITNEDEFHADSWNQYWRSNRWITDTVTIVATAGIIIGIGLSGGTAALPLIALAGTVTPVISREATAELVRLYNLNQNEYFTENNLSTGGSLLGNHIRKHGMENIDTVAQVYAQELALNFAVTVAGCGVGIGASSVIQKFIANPTVLNGLMGRSGEVMLRGMGRIAQKLAHFQNQSFAHRLSSTMLISGMETGTITGMSLAVTDVDHRLSILFGLAASSCSVLNTVPSIRAPIRARATQARRAQFIKSRREAGYRVTEQGNDVYVTSPKGQTTKITMVLPDGVPVAAAPPPVPTSATAVSNNRTTKPAATNRKINNQSSKTSVQSSAHRTADVTNEGQLLDTTVLRNPKLADIPDSFDTALRQAYVYAESGDVAGLQAFMLKHGNTVDSMITDAVNHRTALADALLQSPANKIRRRQSISQELKQKIMEAHNQSGTLGKKLSYDQIKARVHLLKEGQNTTSHERSMLFKAGITGKPEGSSYKNISPEDAFNTIRTENQKWIYIYDEGKGNYIRADVAIRGKNMFIKSFNAEGMEYIQKITPQDLANNYFITEADGGFVRIERKQPVEALLPTQLRVKITDGKSTSEEQVVSVRLKDEHGYFIKEANGNVRSVKPSDMEIIEKPAIQQPYEASPNKDMHLFSRKAVIIKTEAGPKEVEVHATTKDSVTIKYVETGSVLTIPKKQFKIAYDNKAVGTHTSAEINKLAADIGRVFKGSRSTIQYGERTYEMQPATRQADGTRGDAEIIVRNGGREVDRLTLTPKGIEDAAPEFVQEIQSALRIAAPSKSQKHTAVLPPLSSHSIPPPVSAPKTASAPPSATTQLASDNASTRNIDYEGLGQGAKIYVGDTELTVTTKTNSMLFIKNAQNERMVYNFEENQIVRDFSDAPISSLEGASLSAKKKL